MIYPWISCIHSFHSPFHLLTTYTNNDQYDVDRNDTRNIMQFLEYRKHSTNTSLSVSILSSTALLVKIFTFPRRCASNAFVQWLLLFDARWAARSTCYSSISRFMVYFREKNYHERNGFSINLTIVYSNKRMTRMETLSRRSLRSHVISLCFLVFRFIHLCITWQVYLSLVSF